MSEQIVVLDESKMLEIIQSWPDQLEKAWTTVKTQELTIQTDKIANIVILGMGGSGIPGHLTKELANDSWTVPVQVWSDYRLPSYVDERTLVIAVSYSGNTEETIDGVKHAVERKAQIIGVSHKTGGKLNELAGIHGFPIYHVEIDCQPRSSVGSQYGILLGVLSKLGLIPLKEETYFQALQELKLVIDQKIFLDKAEDLAVTLNNKIPVILAHSPLTAVAKRWKNSFNENAKTFAFSDDVPEVCHNVLVGLDFPSPEKLSVLFIESSYGFSRNVARKDILEKLFTEKNIPFTPLSVKTGSVLAEQWLMCYFGDLLSYYLAGVYGIDPTPVEIIEKLKAELAKL